MRPELPPIWAQFVVSVNVGKLLAEACAEKSTVRSFLPRYRYKVPLNWTTSPVLTVAPGAPLPMMSGKEPPSAVVPFVGVT